MGGSYLTFNRQEFIYSVNNKITRMAQGNFKLKKKATSGGKAKKLRKQSNTLKKGRHTFDSKNKQEAMREKCLKELSKDVNVAIENELKNRAQTEGQSWKMLTPAGGGDKKT